MPVLYTLLGIIAFFVILVSIPVHVSAEYTDKTVLLVQWLFLKIPLYDSSAPPKEKKPKKEKKGKKEAQTPPETAASPEQAGTGELPADAAASAEATGAEAAPAGKQQKAKQPGNGLLKQLYLDQGYEGIERMLLALHRSLSGFLGKLLKTFTVNELTLDMTVAGKDAATTAIRYGRLCAWVYPLLGKIVSTCKVRKYDVDIDCDFLAPHSEGTMYFKAQVTPLRITNAAVVLALQLLFKVLLKILFSNQKSKKSRTPPGTGGKSKPGSSSKSDSAADEETAVSTAEALAETALEEASEPHTGGTASA